MSIKLVKLVYESLDSMETMLTPVTMYAHRTHKIVCVCIQSCKFIATQKGCFFFQRLKLMANGNEKESVEKCSQ